VLSVAAAPYTAAVTLGSPILGALRVPSGWISVDAVIGGARFHLVNTHLPGAIAGVPEAEQSQKEQAAELLTKVLPGDVPTILAGDFNSNAEPGPENTGVAQRIVQAGFTDAWQDRHPSEPGYTWPLFGEDQASGPTSPNERIDLVFAVGPTVATTPEVVSAARTGTTNPYASDHAGVVVKCRVQ
jgi:endonuclease/exonuclease/phosphatase family metal-dependent hydrolase